MKQRIITAFIALIILTPIIIYGKWPFLMIAYIIATIGLFELVRMSRLQNNFIYFIIATIFLCFIMYPAYDITFLNFTMNQFDILILFIAVLLIATVITKNRFTFDQAGFLLLATLYIGIAFYFLIMLRFTGLNYFLFVLFIIWATDTGAYFIGKSFGKRKLWPEISPNKTIGGAIGGVLTAIVVGIIFQMIYPFDKSFAMVILITIVISIFGQIGDLVASAIKRHYKVKDSGRIFPGHGGVLDRLDSLLFVLIVLNVLPFFN